MPKRHTHQHKPHKVWLASMAALICLPLLWFALTHPIQPRPPHITTPGALTPNARMTAVRTLAARRHTRAIPDMTPPETTSHEPTKQTLHHYPGQVLETLSGRPITSFTLLYASVPPALQKTLAAQAQSASLRRDQKLAFPEGVAVHQQMVRHPKGHFLLAPSSPNTLLQIKAKGHHDSKVEYIVEPSHSIAMRWPHNLRKQGAGAIFGRIVSPDQTPIAGTVVDLAIQPPKGSAPSTAFPIAIKNRHNSTQSDATGYFLFPSLPAETYALRLKANGWQATYRNDIELLPGEQRDLGIIQFTKQNGTIKGTITWNDGTLCAKATIYAIKGVPGQGAPSSPEDFKISAALRDGTFKLTDVSAGQLVLQASCTPKSAPVHQHIPSMQLIPQPPELPFEDPYATVQNKRITLRKGETAIVHFRIGEGSTPLSGQVLDENGAPVSAVKISASGVFLHKGHKEFQVATATTDAQGRYTLKGLQPGIYRIELAHKEWRYTPKQKHTLTPTNATFNIQLPGGRLTVDIQTSTKNTHDSVSATLTRQDQFAFEVSRSATMSQQVTFQYLPDVPFQLTLTANGYVTWRKSDLRLPGPGAHLHITAQMQPTGSLALKLIDQDQTPITSPEIERKTKTGTYEIFPMLCGMLSPCVIDWLPPGPHTLRIKAEGIPAQHHQITIPTKGKRTQTCILKSK